MNEHNKYDLTKILEELTKKLDYIIETGEKLLEMHNDQKKRALEYYLSKKNSEYWALYDRMMQAYEMYRLTKCNKCANKYLMYQKYVWFETRKLDTEIEHPDSLLSGSEEEEEYIYTNDPEY